MKTIRIIPRLEIKGPNLVKGIHLEGLRVLGKPEDFARYYYESGADELLYIDVVASLYGRNSLHDIIALTARKIFIPLTVGGGIRSIKDIRDVLRAGADKVSINTAAIKNPDFIEQAAHIFGSSTITVAIEASKGADGKYLAYTDNGREYTGIEVVSWAKKAEHLGAGEILLTSIDREGTGQGFDLELTKMVSGNVSIPVVACGGAGNTQDIYDVITQADADAVAVSSLLHYEFSRHQKEALSRHFARTFEQEGNIEFLKKGKGSSTIESTTIADIKDYLLKQGVSCRVS